MHKYYHRLTPYRVVVVDQLVALPGYEICNCFALEMEEERHEREKNKSRRNKNVIATLSGFNLLNASIKQRNAFSHSHSHNEKSQIIKSKTEEGKGHPSLHRYI